MHTQTHMPVEIILLRTHMAKRIKNKYHSHIFTYIYTNKSCDMKVNIQNDLSFHLKINLSFQKYKHTNILHSLLLLVYLFYLKLFRKKSNFNTYQNKKFTTKLIE